MTDPTLESTVDPEEVLNVNVGVLGHVDSGKTSLVKALSTLLSTAALDKSKQSRQRGMTLDLGFSCFFLDLPKHLQTAFPTKKQLQITLVDCPGHASLIRTIIGGAQIIDVVLLVVDAVKGWQAQTTECLVLAELCSPHLVVALNKVDQLLAADAIIQHEGDSTSSELDPNEQRDRLDRKIDEVRKNVCLRLKATRFQFAPIVGVAACVGGEKVAAENSDDHPTHAVSGSSKKNETINMDFLVSTLKEKLPVPKRVPTGAFYFAIDHCFPIRGRGTVLTGTCLSGSVSVNEMIEFPTLALDRKVKSMQMFKRQVPKIVQGDRAGICVSNLDSDLLERGIAATPGAVPLWKGAIAVVRKIKYFAGALPGNSRYHVSVGHTTVMATAHFWGARELAAPKTVVDIIDPAIDPPSKHSDKSKKRTTLHKSSLGGGADLAELPRITFDFQQDFMQQDSLLETLNDEKNSEPLLHWALLHFQTPVHCPIHSLVIGSRLDTVDNASGDSSSCRLAFSGRLIERIDPDKDASRVRLFVPKQRQGVVSRRGDLHKRTDDGKVVCYELFGTDLFKKETNMKAFIGMKLVTNLGDVGEIKSSFGTSGQFRVFFPAGTETREGDSLTLHFKRFVHDPDKAMHQDIHLPTSRMGSRIEIEKKKTKKVSEPGVHRFGEVTSVKGDPLENGKQNMVIIAGFFAPEINIKDKSGMKVIIPSTGEEGTVVGPFGKAGKCKVSFLDGTSTKVGDKAELRP